MAAESRAKLTRESHADAYYWPLTPSKCVTLWLAIDDVDAENGPMKFVSQSHRHGPIHHDQSAAEEQNVLSLTVPEAESWGSEVAVIAPLKAGQASLHSDMLLHSSDANSSSRRRCGVALTYHTPDVRFNVVGDHSPEDFYGFVCRGHDSSGYWPEDVAPPEGDFVPRRDAEKGLLDPLVDRSKL